MEFTTVQWNMGGAKLPRDGADPTVLASYSVDGLEYIIDFLRQQNADIITLQETHTSDGYSQTQLITEALSYQGWVNDELADSHVEIGQRLGQAIITKQPITDHNFVLFNNPRFTVDLGDGRIEVSHDKGRTRCTVTLENGQKITVQTTHVTPFRRSNTPIDSPQAQRVLEDVADRLMDTAPGIIQADFNIDVECVEPHLPSLFSAGFHEIPQHVPTTVKDAHYDHILYRDLEVVSSTVLSNVATDHYPIVTRFKLPET